MTHNTFQYEQANIAFEILMLCLNIAYIKFPSNC